MIVNVIRCNELTLDGQVTKDFSNGGNLLMFLLRLFPLLRLPLCVGVLWPMPTWVGRDV